MFNSGKIIEEIKKILQAELKDLQNDFCLLQEAISPKFAKIDDKIRELEQIETRVDRKLNEFYKEMTDKYFNNLNSFMRWNKEIALVAHLGGKDVDLSALKRELMKPYLDEKYAVNKALEAEKINKTLQSQGEQIRIRRSQLYQEFLKAEREAKDPKLTQVLKAKVEMIDEIIKGVENADQ